MNKKLYIGIVIIGIVSILVIIYLTIFNKTTKKDNFSDMYPSITGRKVKISINNN